MARGRTRLPAHFPAHFASRDPWVVAGLSALVVCLGLLVWSVFLAVRLTPTGDAAAPQFVARDSLAARERVPELRIADVVDRNVFAPDRSAPVARYRLDGADEPDDYTELPTPPALPVVLGTAVGTEPRRSFAMCQLDGAPTVIVRVGDQLGPYTVRSISRGSVEFTAPSGARVAITANPS